MAGIADIRFLTRPVRGYAGGDLVINPPTAAEELEGITTFKPSEFYKNLAKSADWKAGAEHVEDWATGQSIDILGDQIAKEMRARGIKISFHPPTWKGFKNWMMGMDAQGNKKTFSPKENRRALSTFFNKIPGNSTRRFILNSLIKGGIKFSSPAAEAIQKYFERSEYVKKSIAKGKEIDEAIAKIDPDLIENMTGKDLQIYLKDNFDLDVTDRTIYRKIRKKNIPVRSNIDWEIGSKVKEALEEIGNTENLTPTELWAKPQIQKIAEEGFLTPETLSEFRIKLKYPIKQKLVDYFDKLGADHDAVVKYITENNPTPAQLIKKFPKLQQAIDEGKIKQSNITAWRYRNNLSYDDSNLVKKGPYQILKKKRDAHELSKYLEFVPQSGEGKPMRVFGPFGRETIRTRSGVPQKVLQSKIYTGHPLGEGGVEDATRELITSKLRMIPEKSRKGVNLREQLLKAKFFLTPTENYDHRKIEDNLVSALVKKYKLLGWEFVEVGDKGEGEWVEVETEKKSMLKKSDRDKKIKEYEDIVTNATEEIKKLDAFTKFYNPVTDELVTYGIPESKTLPLSNFMNQVLRGEKKFEQGGMVGMDYLTRPI